MNQDPAAFVNELVNTGSADPALLLQYLVQLQSTYSHVPADAIAQLASELDVAGSEITGIIEFYSFLHLRPRGDYDIYFSDSITDHMLGSRELVDYLCEKLGVSVGEPREDGRATIDLTSCTGMCEQGPALLINGMAINHLDRRRIDEIVQLIEANTPLAEWPPAFFSIEQNIFRKDILLGSIPADPDLNANLKQLLSEQPEDILDKLQQAGLRGRGGAGFTTAIKWRSCKQADATQRYVVCNADEGEPGTFKDRVLLQSYAAQLIEGMTLCAHTINASKGYIYLRGEYLYLVDELNALLQQHRDQGLLGNNVGGHDGFDFDIDIHLGAGAYICGEESALIESLEGKRGVPRRRPPFPVTHGFMNQPTVVNNVETFIAAAQIVLNGVEWFRAVGTEQSSGTKLLSISGDCERPGVYEYPFGTSIQQILEDCGANNAQAVQVAGAAGVTIPPQQFDRTIAFEDIATAGSFMVFNQQRNLLDMVQNFAHFFVHESCGFCTPCRVGGSLLKDLVDKVHAGHASNYDLDEMRRIAAIMHETSFCGLGATAANHVMQTLDGFPQLYRQQLRHEDYEPAFDLDASLEQARQITHRDGPDAHIES